MPDDNTCPWCGREITATDTITITPRGHMHAECWAVHDDGMDEDASAERGQP